MLKRPTAAIKWVIALSIPLGLASFLPAASWVYAELCDYKFMVGFDNHRNENLR